MKAAIYLNERKNENLLAYVDLEVVPRGIYEIDGVDYIYKGQPKFIISKKDRRGDELQMVELIVERA